MRLVLIRMCGTQVLRFVKNIYSLKGDGLVKNKTLIALILSISFVIMLSACGNTTTNPANTTTVTEATAAQTIVIDQPWLSETPEQVYVNNGTLGIDLPPMTKQENISQVLTYVKSIEYYETTDIKLQGTYPAVVLVYPDYKIFYGVVVPDGYMWLGINDVYTEYKISKEAATNLYTYLSQYIQDNPANETKAQ